jgi:hypothetical protein
MGLVVTPADLLGFSMPASTAQEESELRVARSWAGLTSQGRILISIEQLAAGQDVNVLVSHETVHDVLIFSSVLGMQQLALSLFAMPPWPEFSLSGVLRRLLASTIRASVRAQEGCATFLPSLARDAADLAGYLAALPAEYRDLIGPLDWLHDRARRLGQDAITRLVFAIGRFSLGVPLPATVLTDPAAIASFFRDPASNPNERFARACAALKEADVTDLARLSDAPRPEAEIAGRWCSPPVPCQIAPTDGAEFVATWRDIIREMIATWSDQPRLTDAEREELRDAASHPELLMPLPAPGVLKAVLTHTVSADGPIADHPPVTSLVPYELAYLSYNGFENTLPGVEGVSGHDLPLAPGDAALWLASPTATPPDMAARLSEAELRDYLAAAAPDTTIVSYDGTYMFPDGDLLAGRPLLRGRPHLVLVVSRSPAALIDDPLLSVGLAGQTELRYTVVGGDTPGVSYLLVAPATLPYPVLIVAAPWPTADRARQELRAGRGRPELRWTEVEQQEFFATTPVKDLVRFFAWFEDKPWPPGTERQLLGPPPDSRGRGGDAVQNLSVSARRPLDKAGTSEAHGDYRRAGAGYAEMMDSGDRHISAAGAVALGMMLSHLGDQRGAVAAYEQGASRADPDLSPLAILYLGQVKQATGDFPAAAEAFLATALTRHPDHAPPAAFCLARLGAMTGMSQSRRAELLRWVVGSGHPGVARLAAAELDRIGAQGGSP